MVTITSHIFIHIFQMVYFSAVKFTRGNEKNMGFLLIPKFSKVWKKSEAIGPGTFKWLTGFNVGPHILLLPFEPCAAGHKHLGVYVIRYLGTISLTCTIRHKMGILLHVANQFHKRFHNLECIWRNGTFILEKLTALHNLWCVQGSCKVGVGWQGNTHFKV